MRSIIKIIFVKIKAGLDTFISFLAVLFFSSRSSASKIKKIKPKGKSCYVIANGPSLTKEIDFITNDRELNSILVLNFFCNSKMFFDLQPEYYCISDPLVFNSEDGYLRIPEVLDDFIINMNKVSWPCVLFFPQHFSTSFVLNKINNNNINFCTFNSTPLLGESKIVFNLFKRNLGMPIPESVIISGIFLAINIGYKKIDLFGVDHSWIRDFKVDASNSSSFFLAHFYGASSRTKNDRSVSQFLISQYRLFRSHEVLEHYARVNNITIINNTKDSLIDSYERRN